MKKNLVAVLAMAAFLVAFTSTARADIAPFSGCATNGNVLGVTSSVCFTVVGDVLTTTSVVINGGDVVKSIDEIGWQPNTGTLVNLVSTTRSLSEIDFDSYGGKAEDCSETGACSY
jgi:uncharacterized lipoprotein YajG